MGFCSDTAEMVTSSGGGGGGSTIVGAPSYYANALSRFVEIDVTNPGTDTFDDVVLVDGDLLYLANQSTTPTEKGLWVFHSSATPLTRATDWAVSDVIKQGTVVTILSGTRFLGTQWLPLNNLDTDAVVGTDEFVIRQCGFRPETVNNTLVPYADNIVDLGASGIGFRAAYIDRVNDASDLAAARFLNRTLNNVSGIAVFDWSEAAFSGLLLFNGHPITQETGTLVIKTETDTGSQTAAITLSTGNDTSVDQINTGALSITTGSSGSGGTGEISLTTGTADDTEAIAPNVGSISLITGTPNGDSNGGSITIQATSPTGGGTAGAVNIQGPGVQIQSIDTILSITSATELDLNSSASESIVCTGLSFRPPVHNSDPGSAAAGDIYYNSTLNKLKVYNGTAWETVTSV
jgi:hypothetical protein